MRNKIFIFCTIIFNSCSNKEGISGIYSSSKASRSDVITYNTKSSIGNSTLVLKKDSTYLYKTCGIFSFGTWLLKKDSLHLEIKKIEFSNAIAKKNGKENLPKELFVFKVNNNNLINAFPQFENKKAYIINKLQKDD